MNHPVIIVGGGLSGLSSAVALSARSVPVVVLDQKPALGGRAYSFVDPTTGETIDNGQHVLIAGYERTLAFLDTIGTRHLLFVQPKPELLFHHPVQGFTAIRLPPLPAPLHFVAGILFSSFVSLSDRVRLLRAGRILMKSADVIRNMASSLTILQWLSNAGQSEELIRCFWEPLAVSIMNEGIDTASAATFLLSVKKAFLGHSRNAALAIPTVGLSQLYVDRAEMFIRERGGVIRCGVDVDRIELEGTKASGVWTRGGERLKGCAVILAIPPEKLAVLQASSGVSQLLSDTRMGESPIVSIHLWYSHDFMPQMFVGLIGRRVQWLFNKRLISREKAQGGHVSAVISGARKYVSMTNNELVSLAHEDIRSAYPQVDEKPIHALVIREKRATYSSSPTIDKLRPNHRTHIEGLYLAGDWTNTGYPAVIESAVMSGEKCADHVLTQLEHPSGS